MGVFSSHEGDVNNTDEERGARRNDLGAALEQGERRERDWAGRRGRAARRLRVATVCLMTFVMCAESLLGSGVASAIAETYEGAQEQTALTAQADEADASGDDAVEGDDSTAADATDAAGETGDSADEGQDVAEGRTSDDAADASDDQVSESSEGGQDDSLAARDWTEANDNLVLSSDGIDFASSLAELASERAAAQDEADANGAEPDASVYGVGSETPDGVTLPSSLPAKLNLRGSLDATAADGRDGDAGHNVLVAGDTFAVALPDGITLAAEAGSELDLYAPDSDGNPGTVKVATAVVQEDGSLKATLVVPVDTATGDESAISATASFVRNLDVKVASSLVQTEASTVTWELQAGRTAELSIPSKADVANQLGLISDNSAAVVDDVVTGYKATEFAGSASYTTVWADNANGDGNRPSVDSMAASYKLQFRTKQADGEEWGEWVDFSDDALVIAELGITDEQAANIAVSGTDAGNSYVFAAGGDETLPSKVEHTADDEAQTVTTYDVEWQIVRTGDVDGYAKLEQGAYGGKWDATYYGSDSHIECLQQLQDVTFDLTLRDGGANVSDYASLDAWYAAFGLRETLSVSADATALESYKSEGLKSYLEGEGASFAVSQSSANTVTISYSAPKFAPDNEALDYALSHSERNSPQADGTVDYYQAAYANSDASYASDVAVAHNKGTIVLTHTGTTTYNAEKIWCDENDTGSRPETSYSLWRYSTNGGSPSTAAQVADSNGKFVSFTVSAADNQAAGTNPIDLAEKMQDAGFDVQSQLAKYDPDGYAYVYFLREDGVSGYTRVAGTVDESCNVSYNKAVYYGSVWEDGGWNVVTYQRNGKDVTASADSVCVYNNGTICNVRTDTVQAKTTKTWEAGAFQDQLKDVVVTMTLKRRAANSGDEWETVKNGSKDYAVDLTGWTAANFSLDASASMPRYDMRGREYEYIWCETNISSATAGKVGEVTPNADGVTLTSVLNLTDESGATEAVTFVGEYDSATGVITNGYSSTTVARFTKNWVVQGSPEGATEANPYGATLGQDGKLHFTVTDEDGKEVDKVFPSELKVSLFQGDSSYATGLVMDGNADSTWTTAKAADGTSFKYRESAAWQLDFIGLPKYDASGSKYSYQCYEENAEGFSSYPSFKPAGRTGKTITDDEGNELAEANYSTASNSPYYGEGTTVNLSKKWVDDGNNTGRYTVTMRVTAKTDVVNKAGETLYSAGDVIGEVELSEENGWYGSLGIAANGGTYCDPSETPDTPSSGFCYTVEEVANDNYDIVTKDADGTYSDNTPDVVKLSPWTAGTSRLISRHTDGSSYVYDISYAKTTRTIGNQKVTVVETTNRRVGLVNVQLSKTWSDRGADVSDRPDAYYKISADSGDRVFYADADGKVYVRLPNSSDGETYYLYTSDDHAEGTELTTETATIASDGASVSIAVDKTAASGTEVTSYVYGLPKYNQDGSTFTYSVRETMDADGDYASTEVENYNEFDSLYQHSDTKVAKFKNYRSDSKSVTFHSRWYDQYVKEVLGQRPDIYITLYRGVVNEDGSTTVDPKPVTGYESYKWVGTDEDSSHPNYAQYVTIENLPEYASDGAEYVYYAKMTVSTNAATYAALDYLPQGYATGKTEDENYPDDPYVDPTNGSKYWTEVNDEVAAAAPSSTVSGAVVLREEGTFVYKIADTVTVQGTKTWSNLPSDYSGELPDISVFLQRAYVGDGDEKWAGLDMSKAKDGSGLTGAGYDVACDFSSEQADGKTVVAYATVTGMTTASRSYTFSFSHYGDNTAGTSEDEAVRLPLYDSSGKRYAYSSREVIDSLIKNDEGEPAGGISLEDLIAQQASATSSYTIYSPTITSSGNGRTFRVTNAFVNEKQQGVISVKKLFSGRATGDKFPTVEFMLYRKSGDSWTKVASKKLDTSAMSGNDSGTVTFEGLAIYDPSGQTYEYKVVEGAISGYETYAANGDLDDVTAQTSEVTGLAAELAAERSDASKATFKNDYVSSSATLSGTKTWYDEDNLTGVRPEGITLKVVRSYDEAGTQLDGDGTVTLQSTDPDAANYLSWNKDADTNTWTYSIANLEKWSPSGGAWYYTVSEDPVPDGYTQTDETGGTARADNASQMGSINFGNEHGTSVSFRKTWSGDSNDAYSQRPYVYVRLESRVTTGGASTEWKDAGQTLIDTFGASGDSVVACDDFDANCTVAGVSGYYIPGAAGNNSRKCTLYALANNNRGYVDYKDIWQDLPTKGKVAGADATIEYRVVEVLQVYNQRASDSELIYRKLVSPSETTGSYGAETGDVLAPYTSTQDSATNITNKLDSTSATIVKQWSDGDNKWGERPDSVTYYARRKVEGGSWSWLTVYGGSTKVEFKVSASNNWTKTFEGLAKTDTDGKEYTYQFVEAVPKGYSVTDDSAAFVASDASDANDKTSLVAVTTLTTGANLFTNELDTVSVTGTKSWVSGHTIPDDVKLTVTQYKGSVATDVTSRATVTWDKTDVNNWKYTVSGLPATAKDGTAYQYSVTETAGDVDGYYPTNPTGKATGDGETLDGGTITNTPTKFTFDKTGTDNQGVAEGLNGVEFTVKKNGATVAVWRRDADGDVTVTGTSGCTCSDDGYIVGLPAGDYTVSETLVPSNHLKVADFTVRITKTGDVSVPDSTGVTVTKQDGTKAATVSVSDAVVRGNVNLYKYYEHGGKKVGLAMTFDLYKKADAGDVKIATGITTDGSGNWASVNSDIELTGLDKYYTKLSDGLPEGEYYFRETGTSCYTVDAQSEYPFTVVTNNDGKSQPTTKTVNAANDEFNATATLSKTDATSRDGVDGAVFTLKYGDTVVATNLESGKTYGLDAKGEKVESTADSGTAGLLKVNGLKKGTYTLTETANTGYVVNSTEMSVIVTEDADSYTFTNDGSMENERKLGALTFTKTDGTTGLANCIFKLQVKNGDSWQDVEGKTALQTGADGRVVVESLGWGTYRFVEVTPASGYYGTATTGEATIDRANDGKTIDLGTVTNASTSVTLRKTDGTNVISSGSATFSVAPKAGSAFADGTTATRSYATTNGTVTITGELVVGNEYELTETVAPDGYELETSTTTLSINAEGESSVSGGTGFTASGYTVSKADEVISVAFVKRDAEDASKLLSGAKYHLTPVAGSTFADGSTASRDYTTDKDGSFTLTNVLKQGCTYSLTEVGAKDGYARSASSLMFTVGSDGTIVAKGSVADDMKVDEGGVSVSLTDKAIEFKVTKSAEGYEAASMKGAEFTLEGTFADGSSSKTLVIGTNGESDVLSAQLIVGNTYKVSETKAPSGFTLIDGSATFSVASNGSLTSLTGDAAVWGMVANEATVTAVDTPTKFTFNKVGTDNAGAAEDLNGVEFTVKRGNVAMAVWTRDESGHVSVTKTAGCKGSDDGYIVGLPAGSYTVSETLAPADHLKVDDFTLLVSEAGDISVSDPATITVEAGTRVATITVSDEVVRGAVSLYKYYEHAGKRVGLAMTFDLYKKGADGDVRVATGIATDASGNWASADSDIALTSLGKYYTKLSDGLPEGKYYLKETGSSSYTVDAQTTYPFTVATNNDGRSQPTAQYVEAKNDEFNATATLAKTDATSHDGVDGAVFTLKYGDVVVSESIQSGKTYSLDATGAKVESVGDAANTGAIVVSGLKKGTYTLTETANTGYVVDSTPLAVEVVNGTTEYKFTDDGTFANVRKTGTLTLTKTDGSAGLPNCTFKLQQKSGGNWEDVEGKTALKTGADGKISVSGLGWGTYRFVEVSPAPGYSGTAVSNEVTFDRANAGSALDAGTVTNATTSVTLKKTDGTDAITSSPATFKVTPKSGSAFADGGTAPRTYTTSASTGTVTITGELVVGDEYELTETVAPDGYELETSVATLTIDANGAPSVSGGNGFSASGSTISKADELISVTFVKRDADDASKLLSGATYSVEPAEGSAFADGTTAAREFITDGSGSFTLTNVLKQGCTYKLNETRAKDGYARSASTLTFAVGTDGTIAAEGAEPSDMKVDEGGTTVSLTDKAVAFKVTKSADGYDVARMKGAEFALEGTFADGSKKQTLTIGEDGQSNVLSALLVVGQSYTITETKSPLGFTVIEGSASFTVAPDGTLEEFTGDYDSWGPVAGEATVAAVDAPADFAVKKVTTDGKTTGLAGAVFTVVGTFADGSTSQDITTDNVGEGNLSAKLVVGQTYTVTETHAPLGYKLANGKAKFRVSNSGELEQLAVEGSFAFATDFVGVIVSDEPTSVSFTKAGEGDDAMDQVQLTVTPAAGSAFVDGSASKTLTMGEREDGTYGTGLTGQLIAGNSYVLTETTAQPGYSKFTGAFTFTVDEQGKVSKTSSTVANGSVEVSGDGLTIAATDNPVELQVIKTDAAGQTVLAGAEFSIADEDGTVVDTLTTGEDGTATSAKKLNVGGTYVLSETKAPAGYKQIGSSFTFVVQDDGTIKAAGDAPVDPAWSINQEGELVARSVSAADEATELTLYKRDASGAVVVSSQATFELTGVFANGEERTVELTTSGETGSAELERALLVADGATQYTLRETAAPAGYMVNVNEFRFTVATDGTITPAEGMDESGYSVSEDGVSVVARDDAISLVVDKRGSDGASGASMAGATFAVSGDVFAGEAEGTGSIEVTTDEDGTLELDGVLVAGGAYSIEELKAPAGYSLIDGTLTFTVSEDGRSVEEGSVAFEGADEGKLAVATGQTEDGVPQIMVAAVDDPVAFELTKTDETGARLLEGAEFTLMAADGSAFADGSKSLALTTASDGKVELSAKLVVGATYVLTEAKAPAGYKAISGSLTFTVGADGAIVSSSANGIENGSVTVDEDGLGITVADELEPEKSSGRMPQTGDMAIVGVLTMALLGLGTALEGIRRRLAK